MKPSLEMQAFHGRSWKHRVLEFSFIGVLGDFWDIYFFIQNGMPFFSLRLILEVKKKGIWQTPLYIENFIKQHEKQIICIPF